MAIFALKAANWALITKSNSCVMEDISCCFIRWKWNYYVNT